MKKIFLLFGLTIGTLAGQAQTTNVTFRVDMNNFTGTFTTPEVNGTWNNWCGNCNVMSDPDNDGIWTAIIPLPIGANVEYKFSHDNWTGQEMLSPSASCTNGNAQYTNRILTVPSADTVLGVVCWGQCTPCGGQPTAANITFRVDMSEFAGSFTTPETNGTFNNWCGNCAPMSDANNDNIWEITINLPIGDTVEYKFSHDNWTGQETNDPTQPCTNGNTQFTNRVLVISGDTILPAVCWGSCLPCGMASSIQNQPGLAMKVYPNPAKGIVKIETAEAGLLTITDLAGRVVKRNTLETAGLHELAIDELGAGLYLVHISGKLRSGSQRLVVR
jgi:hypothetical protein